MKMAPFSLLAGTIVLPKAPALGNAITVIADGQVQSLNNTAPGTPWRNSTPLPHRHAESHHHFEPILLCGNAANGIVVSDGSKVYYMTGVGIQGAVWNPIPDYPDSEPMKGMSGDPVNGVVGHNGSTAYYYDFVNGWQPMGTSTHITKIDAIAGDPKNGVLIAAAHPHDAGPSTMWYATSGCACTWVAFTGQPVKVKVSLLAGTTPNFLVYGENQLFTMTVTAPTATVATASAAVAALPQTPFAIGALSGDGTAANNGITALDTSGALVASAPAGAASWTVVALLPATR